MFISFKINTYWIKNENKYLILSIFARNLK
jgi:hypothetical protein